MQNIRDILLLGEGAAIRPMVSGELVVQPEFRPFDKSHFGEASQLVRELAAKIAAIPGLECDYIAVFEDRPASAQFAQWLAGVLSEHWQRRVDVLAISRQGRRNVLFRYYRLKTSASERTVVHELHRLSRDAAVALVAGKNVLVFAETVKGSAREGCLHLLYSPRAKALNVKVVGLATFAIINRGVRRLIQKQLRLRGRRKLPIVFFAHLGYPTSGTGPTSLGSMLTDAFVSLFHRRT